MQLFKLLGLFWEWELKCQKVVRCTLTLSRTVPVSVTSFLLTRARPSLSVVSSRSLRASLCLHSSSILTTVVASLTASVASPSHCSSSAASPLNAHSAWCTSVRLSPSRWHFSCSFSNLTVISTIICLVIVVSRNTYQMVLKKVWKENMFLLHTSIQLLHLKAILLTEKPDLGSWSQSSWPVSGCWRCWWGPAQCDWRSLRSRGGSQCLTAALGVRAVCLPDAPSASSRVESCPCQRPIITLQKHLWHSFQLLSSSAFDKGLN